MGWLTASWVKLKAPGRIPQHGGGMSTSFGIFAVPEDIGGSDSACTACRCGKPILLPAARHSRNRKSCRDGWCTAPTHYMRRSAPQPN